jgi:hypothetical protein
LQVIGWADDKTGAKESWGQNSLLAFIPSVDHKRDDNRNDDAGTDDPQEAQQSYGFTFHIVLLDMLWVCILVR